MTQVVRVLQEEDIEGVVKLNLTYQLKKQLVDDWEFVVQKHHLVTLPREITVADILAEFVASKVKKGKTAENKVVEEVAQGLKTYFERALGTLLLFRFERAQHAALIANMESGAERAKPMSEIYGPEHLLRLFGACAQAVDTPACRHSVDS